MRLFNSDKGKLDKALKMLKNSVEIDEKKFPHQLIL